MELRGRRQHFRTMLWLWSILALHRIEAVVVGGSDARTWVNQPNCGTTGPFSDSWLASITHSSERGATETKLCSAILLTQSHLLTSLCPSWGTMKAGGTLWADFSNGAGRRKVSRQTEQILGSTSNYLLLLTLEEPIEKEDPAIVPICMHTQQSQDPLSEQPQCHVNERGSQCQSSPDCSFVTVEHQNRRFFHGIARPMAEVSGPCDAQLDESSDIFILPLERRDEIFDKIQPSPTCPEAFSCQGKLQCRTSPRRSGRNLQTASEGIIFPLKTNLCPIYESCSTRTDDFRWVVEQKNESELKKLCQNKDSELDGARISDQVMPQRGPKPIPSKESPLQSQERPDVGPLPDSNGAEEPTASSPDDTDYDEMSEDEVASPVKPSEEGQESAPETNGNVDAIVDPTPSVFTGVDFDPCNKVKEYECLFPYMLESVLRHECIRINGTSMCPVALDADRKPLTMVKCSESCPLERYHTHDDILAEFQELQTEYEKHVEVFSVGKSTLGEPLWVINLSANLRQHKRPPRAADNLDEDHQREAETLQYQLRPKVKLIGNMHGNEPVGRELLIHLAKSLLHGYAAGDENATHILENVNLFILPTMNPDGFDRGQEGRCSGGSYEAGRLSEGRQDLNRNFPTWKDWKQYRAGRVDLEDLKRGRETETVQLMDWIVDGYFHLSINFHDGAVLVNYPWDNYHDSGNFAGPHITEDHDVFYQVATAYSLNHRVMHDSLKSCPDWGYFKDGVTNGAEWYPVEGGMQDFNYMFAGTMEVLVEVSCCKFPDRSQLLTQWEDNRHSLTAFIKEALRGIKGLVTNPNGDIIKDAQIVVKHKDEPNFREFPVRTDQNGVYRRLLVKPGRYEAYAFIEMQIPKTGTFVQKSKSRVVPFDFDPDQEAQRLDFVIESEPVPPVLEQGDLVELELAQEGRSNVMGPFGSKRQINSPQFARNGPLRRRVRVFRGNN
eukprot:maker-scaffold228_size248166-snap-gene-0.11 protein:Tk04319 transcript:maker-scaffold228_size248166-snap-gene-0.11-mRNA-1 annotation:"GH12395"